MEGTQFLEPSKFVNLSKELFFPPFLFSDVFHWACLNSYAASLPTNTAPAGYTCPNCKVCDQLCVSPCILSLLLLLLEVSLSV